MHHIPDDLARPDRHFGRWARSAIAVLLLSLGVGVTTAAFTVVNRVMPHGAPFVSCETAIDFTSDPASALSVGVPSQAELRETITDAYESSYEAAGEAVGSVGSVADVSSSAADDLGERPMAALLAGAALALLVLCTRLAGRLLEIARTTMLVVGATLGALSMAWILMVALGLSSIGLRSVAFAAAVSLLAVRHARAPHASPERSEG